ncbi:MULTISPECIES: hypothetical protein [unclassified Mycoplasma]|uniref:hypothetical protein n=1 Tax=unclassified Mycoplasma TaxID=2683645 RepID=UPI00211B8E67|nr:MULTISPECIES: hypothetical protein [unclassified Mycoplasma]UUM19580.1 hypothetical protein NPA11_02275 [Mycoplasma sp. 1578d]UUM24499.1 hypothetical protein NPA12_02250 [Mycoplasma sp. 3686d]
MLKKPAITKEKLVQDAKNDPSLLKIIEQLQMSDEEIFYKFIDLMNVKLREINPEDYIDRIELIRNAKGLVETKRYFANNEKYRQYLLYNNIVFENLGINQKYQPFSEQLIQKADFFDLYQYQKEFRHALGNAESLKQLKGLFLHSSNWNIRHEILSGLAKDLAFQDLKVTYVNIEYLLDEIKSSFNDNSTDYVINTIMKCDAVIFDNLGYDRLPKWFFKMLVKILNYRITYNKFTCFGSKISQSEIETVLDSQNTDDLFTKGQINDFKLAVKNLTQGDVWVE